MFKGQNQCVFFIFSQRLPHCYFKTLESEMRVLMWLFILVYLCCQFQMKLSDEA